MASREILLQRSILGAREPDARAFCAARSPALIV
jgi:hypothetical protein